jgi:Acetyltransferase (GNAT) family
VISRPLDVREAREEEAAEVALLLNELYLDLYGVEEFRSQDVASWIRDLEVRTLVAVADQELVGWAEASPGGDVQPTWWLDVLVPPQEQRREITEQLVQEAEEVARAASPSGVDAKFYLPEADARLRAVVSERGYRPVSYSFRFERPLDRPPESATWPAGSASEHSARELTRGWCTTYTWRLSPTRRAHSNPSRSSDGLNAASAARSIPRATAVRPRRDGPDQTLRPLLQAPQVNNFSAEPKYSTS